MNANVPARGEYRAAGVTCIAIALILAGTRVAALPEGSGTRIGARGIAPLYDRDPVGLTYLRSTRRRTPSGLLYPFPFEIAPWTETNHGIEVRGALDVGWLSEAGDTSEAGYDQFVDRGPGLLLNRFSVELRERASGAYAALAGGAANRADQYYSLDAGVHGWLNLHAAYDSIPHRLMNDARSPYDGIGSDALTLVSPLVAGTSTGTDVDDALLQVPFQRLAIERRQGRFGVELRPLDRLRLSFDYRHERREGTRPLGTSLGFAFPVPGAGSVIETIAPVDHETRDFSAALQFSHPRLQLNLSASYSEFENDEVSLTWENPFSGFGSSLGRSSLAPGNRWYKLRGELGVALPLRSRLSTTVAWSKGRQDEQLLAPTVNPALANWLDPATALDATHADAEFTTLLIDSRLRLRPWRPLALRAGIRYFDRDSNTEHLSFNPATGFFGYVPEDGFFGAFLLIPRFRAIPYGHTKWNATAGATLTPGWRTTLDFEFERERMEREHRARARTDDDSFRLSIATRAIPHLTLRLSYEVSSRTGSEPNVTRDFDAYAVGPPNFTLPAPFLSGTPVRSLAGFRQFDLADRNGHKASWKSILAIGDTGELSFTASLEDRDYEAHYGVDFDRSGTLNSEIAWLPSARLTASAYTTFEARRRRLRSIESNGAATPFDFLNPPTVETFDPTLFGAGVLVPPPFPFLPAASVFPLENAWTMDSEQHTWAFGLNVETTVTERVTFDLAYTFLRSNEEIDLRFASAGALAAGLAPAASVDELPEFRNTDHIVEASLNYRWNGRWGTRLFYRLQHSTTDDFTQTGLVPRLGNVLPLGHRDEDFTATLFGISTQFRF